ncbi:retrieval of early ER protein Rer1 [Coccomyxa subellipsoidea C-169]|uniref:Protein RER1 n=1 Tax=Coccomyxa subellipsoidea (strain C-169) TaxID=574566 RepID=I0Z8V2_COCSC|nr:retrieval of early ER protein Rer1 [Coccomyxa subellipsoidea C-169]EIE27071.1 retrieval of early ER protein Rer1 [Coccomyxa subellipsoidea C-169]|eukprot:XP_005651615.1 retrieval of early ER protein Rer1 [Coccomyxa subellipsoidea C-169]
MDSLNGTDPYGNSDYSSASKTMHKISQRYRYFLDKTTPHSAGRWLALLGLLIIYAVRVYLLKGFYIVTYALGIFNLNMLLGFLTPQVDPELEGPTLPSKKEDEFRPFVRRLPEFKFWYSSFKALLLGFVVTFFPVFDVPVFWPILLMYWLVLLFVTMKRQIKHMIKYRYIPFSFGKKSYSKGGGRSAKNDK